MHFLYAAHVTDEHLTPDQQRVLRGLRSPTMSTGVETPSHNARPKDFNSAQDWVTAFFDKGAEEVLGYYADDFVWEDIEFMQTITTKEDLYKAFVVFNNSGPDSPFGVHKFEVLSYDGDRCPRQHAQTRKGPTPGEFPEQVYRRYADNIFLGADFDYDEWGYMQWIWKATHNEDFFGIPAAGKTTYTRGTTTQFYRDGKIVRCRTHWNFREFAMQLGVIPFPDDAWRNNPGLGEQGLMRYRLLGKSGLRVSQVALGTMTFGTAADWSRPEEECRPVFDAFAEAGGNFIDTANMYTGGESERIVGRLVKADRDRFVIASKYANALPGSGDANAAGMHRKSLTRSLDASLKRLGVDYIDLYFVHWWDFTTPVEEVQRALDDAVSAGKILHVGLSDVPAWVVSRAQAFHDLRGLVPISAMQLEYSLVQRSIEREHLPLARAHDIGVTAWSPLAGGILTGKYTRKGADTGSKRMDTMQLQPLDARNREIAGALDGIAEELGVTSGQLALAWMMSRDVIPIVGATRAEQLRENLAAAAIKLDDATLKRLDAASAFDAGHPYSMLEWDMPMALGYGGMLDHIDIPRFPGRR